MMKKLLVALVALVLLCASQLWAQTLQQQVDTLKAKFAAYGGRISTQEREEYNALLDQLKASLPPPPPPTLTIACPANQSATSSNGSPVPVFYAAATTTGGTAPVTIAYSTLSGGQFSVGATSVTATASSADGQVTPCSFTVTVTYAAPPPPSVRTHYVRTDGNNSNTGTTNTAGGAWRTIDWAADHVTAGAVIGVQAGTYVEVASPGVSGTSGNTITLVADGAVTTCGMSFAGRSYIRVIGFTMNPNASSCGGSPDPIVSMTGTNTGLEFWNDTVGNTQGQGYKADFVGSGARCDACIWLGGSMPNLGNPGSSNALTLGGNDDFVGYLSFSNICWVGVIPTGNRQRFVNLNFSGFIQCSGSHPDFYYVSGLSTLGYSNNLVEANFGIGTTTSNDNKTFHAQNDQSTPWNDNVWRLNVWHDLGAAAAFSNYLSSPSSGAQNRWRFYNNSHIYGDRAQSGPDYSNCGNVNTNGFGAITFSLFNSIFYQCWADTAVANIAPWGNVAPTLLNYNLGYTPLGSVNWVPDWMNQANDQTNVNPGLVNVGADDFHLTSGSAARGTGGPLTTANGSGSNSTSLTVAAGTGSFFIGSNASNLPQYGGNLVPGDIITVGTTTVQVSSVSGDTLTLASPITWSSGAPVYFGPSATIDIGAYPYKASYALNATYAVGGGTATITPNDASLVRFVVCYSDSVPYAVDNSSPYTCAAPAGTFSARAYPRYASTTQSVMATP